MSDAIMGGSNSASMSSAPPDAANPLTAAAVASSSHANTATSSSKVGSLEDLKEKAPKVYKAIMESIGEMMRRDMQHHQERLKKIIRDKE